MSTAPEPKRWEEYRILALRLVKKKFMKTIRFQAICGVNSMLLNLKRQLHFASGYGGDLP